MTDAIVAPAGQTVIDGNRGHSNHSDHAGDHRIAMQLSTEGRFSDRNHSDTLKSFADLEARNGDKFAQILTAIKEEAGRTRETFLKDKLDEERFKSLRLEVLAK
jgi:hypothetical protein